MSKHTPYRKHGRLWSVEELMQQRGELLTALENLLELSESQICRHENTHRGGLIWEICDDCKEMWADDMGGKPPWKDPKEWVAARKSIARAKGEAK